MYQQKVIFFLSFFVNFINTRDPIKPNEWAYFVKIQCDKNRYKFCYGTLIHARWILTSAFCVNLHCKKVSFDSYDFNKPGIEVVVDKHISHPQYKKVNYEGNTFSVNDIGLIKLKERMKFGEKVKIVKLATYEMNEVNSKKVVCKSADYLKVKSETLLCETHEILQPCSSIQDIYESFGVPDDYLENMCDSIAVTFAEHPHSSFSSGGPLICNNTQYALYIESRRYEDKYTSSWMLVPGYIDWIASVMRLYGDNVNDVLSFLRAYAFRQGNSSRRISSWLTICCIIHFKRL